ncbi:hypothetical protein EVAR_51572_1 [Eumeta japonica]|uniref:Uncharacterized protein n=1 Tax=Eumeta variegata TaxID=151549 RepID=A0A4C1Z7F6_EUMVA|nr:hypothetical protein EVAR_51572_1 [Eumeta japonica]
MPFVVTARKSASSQTRASNFSRKTISRFSQEPLNAEHGQIGRHVCRFCPRREAQSMEDRRHLSVSLSPDDLGTVSIESFCDRKCDKNPVKCACGRSRWVRAFA